MIPKRLKIFKGSFLRNFRKPIDKLGKKKYNNLRISAQCEFDILRINEKYRSDVLREYGVFEDQ